MAKKKPKKRKKIQFSEITFKLSKQQKRAFILFCKHHGITPIKLIKRSIDRYINYVPDEHAKPYVHPRQLNLWDELEKN